APLLGACAQQHNHTETFNEGWTFWSDNQPEKTVVDLPHDAMQTETRSADANCGNACAYFPGNVYHYEKVITLDENPDEKHITLSLEGVYQQSTVFVNEQQVGGYAYGYTGYDVCLDGMLKKGSNTIRIDADNSQAPNSRWYSGAGIYRPLHLRVQDKEAYIEQVKITTKSISPAVVQIETAHHGGEVGVSVRLNGKEVANVASDNQAISIPNAQLWSDESPTLYTAVVELKKDGKIVETQEVKFGIRTLEWNAKDGLLVNGKKTLLRGGCIHHDNGILGAAEYDDAAYRRLQILKAYGFNAIRSAHNPCSEAVLRAADELGIYVMDELWDTWIIQKNPYDYANHFEKNWQSDARYLVKKDYNHPSVIMYSIGNEVAEPANAEGQAIERNIISLLHELDSSRPTTAGMNLMIQMLSTMGMNIFGEQQNAEKTKKMTSEEYNQMAQQSGMQMMQAVLAPQVDDICSPGLDMLDIAGYNYGNLRLGLDAQLHPNRVTVGAETFPYQIYDNWQLVEQIPNLIGDFMWTAWDYIGEVGIGAWYYDDNESAAFTKPFPWVLAGAGAIDLIGNPNAEAYMAKTTWLKDDQPYITVAPIVPGKHLIKSIWRGSNAIPNWSWMGCEGEKTQVEVYTSAPSVQLYLNDELIGEQTTQKNCATFDVVYQPGTLKA
ncbi:MAG: glycoside hydrolase family 2 protein, partial [Bacteroidaceae bacterium]|nr:glycoside hydrolase family 2 protein [Bacteroidaceae bacterium]